MKQQTVKNVKILVALSGGVDSSVTAALLVKAGYDVTGVFVINYDAVNEVGTPCWQEDYYDAVRVAAHLEIPILKWNVVKEYREKVLEYLFQEYEKGNTPNPDVLCNSQIKYGVWLERAKKEGYDILATGHYAKVDFNKNTNRYELLQAKDKNKDQTYFLHQLSQDQLKHAMFPLGDYTKPQVRKLAKKYQLPVADKEESMGICFVGEVPMDEFLSKRIPPKEGKVINTDGKVVGKHTGLAYYTIGQRHGFSQKGGTDPYYVVGKNKNKNELIVGFEDDPALYQKEIHILNFHWISGQEPKFPLSCNVRLRYRQKLVQVTIEKKDNTTVLYFKKAIKAVTPGQFAVVYDKKRCLGGGAII